MENKFKNILWFPYIRYEFINLLETYFKYVITNSIIKIIIGYF